MRYRVTSMFRIVRNKWAWFTLLLACGVISQLCWYPWFPVEDSRMVPLSAPIERIAVEEAHVNTDLSRLMRILTDPNERKAYAWIRMRINQMWDGWLKAIRSEVIQNTVLYKQRPRKKILIYIGVLSKAGGQRFAENQFKGGFLGELVQWSDLISTLYVIGHDITVASEVEQLNELKSFFEPIEQRCNQQGNNFPLIFTDIIGYHLIRKHVGQPEFYYKCRVRILDSFGTEPAYNDREYALTHKRSSGWGGLNLRTQQFWTFFPHSPDNSFVGFVVRQNYVNENDMNKYKKNITLVYGKQPALWQGKADYLKVFMQNGLAVHGTVRKDEKTGKDPDVIPDFVINHGFLNGTLKNLLKKTKIFIGLGSPFEGPAPLEAIAHGAVYVNPRFDPPHDYKKEGKPNSRKITSQNPYAEMFIGSPFVHTVSIHNITEVDKAVKQILNSNVFKAFVPFEFTFEGYMQRISSYVQHQDFCRFESQNWPPGDAVTIEIGVPGQSCKERCREKDLVCEPSHFERINTQPTFTKVNVNCTHFRTKSDVVFPAVDLNPERTCLTQNNRKWFSCVGEDKKLMRICPCRNYIPQQTALCKGCEYT